MRGVAYRVVSVIVLATLVSFSGAGPASGSGPPVGRIAHGLCRAVSTGDYRAYEIHATNMGCRSTRNKLIRWLRTGLPRNSYGWYCGGAGEGKRICSVGNGGSAPHFTFRRRCLSEIRLGGRTYVFYLQRVGCRQARRAVRRLYRSGGDEGRPSGFRCESGSGFRTGGGCFTRGRVRAFGWHPLD